MNFKFKMNITEKDFIAFYNNYLMKTVLKKSNIVIYSVFLLFLLVGPLVAKEYSMYTYLGIFLVILLFLYRYLSTSGKKIYAKNAEALDMTYTLTDENLQFESKDGKADKLWSEFFSLFETEEHIYLYLKNKRGLIFVKAKMTEDAIAFLIQKSTEFMRGNNIKRLQK